MNMKPITARICLPALLMLLISVNRMSVADASVSEPESGARDAISVVMDDNYPPYVFRDEEGTLKGILIDQWDLWSRKTGIEAAVTAMSWPDAVNAMRNGGYDVIDTVFLNDERDEWLDFSAPYASIDVAGVPVRLPSRPPDRAWVSSRLRRVAASICMAPPMASRTGGRISGIRPFWVRSR